MEHGQNATGIASLRNFLAAGEFDDRRQKKPEKLRSGQSDAREKCFPRAASGERDERPSAGDEEEEAEHGANRESELSG